ncbi:unnamed protein product [Closterium sp. Naga37s-1]|nr:unnamed protein product [Closterium sp. Naga37s-1]
MPHLPHAPPTSLLCHLPHCPTPPPSFVTSPMPHPPPSFVTSPMPHPPPSCATSTSPMPHPTQLPCVSPPPLICFLPTIPSNISFTSLSASLPKPLSPALSSHSSLASSLPSSLPCAPPPPRQQRGLQLSVWFPAQVPLQSAVPLLSLQLLKRPCSDSLQRSHGSVTLPYLPSPLLPPLLLQRPQQQPLLQWQRANYLQRSPCSGSLPFLPAILPSLSLAPPHTSSTLFTPPDLTNHQRSQQQLFQWPRANYLQRPHFTAIHPTTTTAIPPRSPPTLPSPFPTSKISPSLPPVTSEPPS